MVLEALDWGRVCVIFFFVFVAETRNLFFVVDLALVLGVAWLLDSIDSLDFRGICTLLVFGIVCLEVEGKASLLFTPGRKVWSGLFSAGLVLRSSSGGLVLC